MMTRTTRVSPPGRLKEAHGAEALWHFAQLPGHTHHGLLKELDGKPLNFPSLSSMRLDPQTECGSVSFSGNRG